MSVESPQADIQVDVQEDINYLNDWAKASHGLKTLDEIADAYRQFTGNNGEKYVYKLKYVVNREKDDKQKEYLEKALEKYENHLAETRV
jgi:hypothetical protein